MEESVVTEDQESTHEFNSAVSNEDTLDLIWDIMYTVPQRTPQANKGKKSHVHLELLGMNSLKRL